MKIKTKRQRLNKIIVGGLRDAIRIHGPITKLLIGSAAKRIVGTLSGTLVGKEISSEHDIDDKG